MTRTAKTFERGEVVITGHGWVCRDALWAYCLSLFAVPSRRIRKRSKP